MIPSTKELKKRISLCEKYKKEVYNNIGMDNAEEWLKYYNEYINYYNSEIKKKEIVTAVIPFVLIGALFIFYIGSDIGLNEITGFVVGNESIENITISENTTNLTENESNTSEVNITLNVTEYFNITELGFNDSFKEIKINLSYKPNTLFDSDDNGIANLSDIVDFTVENTLFNWDVNEDELCTRYRIESLDNLTISFVCYGNNDCCNFVELIPVLERWDDSLNVYVNRYDAGLDNVISAQVLFYNITDIYYSSWQNLTARFMENVSEVITVANITEINVTANVTIINSSVKQFGAVIGRPVRWEKRVRFSNLTMVNITIPKKTINFTVKKIIEDEEFEISEDKIKVKKDNEIKTVEEYENEITGYAVRISEGTGLLSRFINWLFDSFNSVTGFAVMDSEKGNETEIIIEEEVEEVSIEYYTDAPFAVEEITSNGKKIIVSAELNYSDVLSYTSIPETEEEGIRIYWYASEEDYIKYFVNDEILLSDLSYNNKKEKNESLNQAAVQDYIGINNNIYKFSENNKEKNWVRRVGLPRLNPVTFKLVSNKTNHYINLSIDEAGVAESGNALDLRSSSLQATWVQNGMEIPAPASNIFDIFPSAYAVPLEVKKYKIDITNDPRFSVSFVDSNENGLIDTLYWITPHTSSQEFEISLTLLTLKSHPQIGSNWTVTFNVTGSANLTIRGVNGTLFGKDIVFKELRCNDELINVSYNESVFVENYSCFGIGRHEVTVLTFGSHYQEFDFGGIKAIAENAVTGCSNGKCIDDNMTDWTAGTFVNTTNNLTNNNFYDNVTLATNNKSQDLTEAFTTTNGADVRVTVSSCYGDGGGPGAQDGCTDNQKNRTTPFDNRYILDGLDEWMSWGYNINEWVEYNFSIPRNIVRVGIVGGTCAVSSRALKDGVIQGSNSETRDRSSSESGTITFNGWDNITNFQYPDTNGVTFYNITFNNTKFYKYYRIWMQNSWGSNRICLAEAELIGDYVQQGNFTSQIFDAGSSSFWNNLTYSLNIPSATNLTFYVRSCNDNVCSGESFSQRHLETGSGIGNFTLNTTITPSNQYFQYYAWYQTGNTTFTPYLGWVNVSYSLLPAISLINQTNDTQLFVGEKIYLTINNADNNWYSTDNGNTNISFGSPYQLNTSSYKDRTKFDIWANNSVQTTYESFTFNITGLNITIDSLSSVAASSSFYVSGKVNLSNGTNIGNKQIYVWVNGSLQNALSSGTFVDDLQANWTAGTFVNTTTNSSATFGNITLNQTGGNYAVNGTFTSQVFDAGSSMRWDNITFKNDTVVKHSTIKFQVRTCGDSACSSGTFVGKDNSTTDYYFGGENGATGNAFNFSGTLSNEQYFQYRAFFETTNSSITPVLEWVNLSSSGPYTESSGNYNVSATSPSLTGIYEVIVNLTYHSLDWSNNASLTVVEYTIPSVVLLNQTNNTQVFYSDKIYFNITDDNAVSRAWWSKDSGITNITPYNSSSVYELNTTNWKFVNNQIIYVWANDTSGNINQTGFMFNITGLNITIDSLSSAEINSAFYVSGKVNLSNGTNVGNQQINIYVNGSLQITGEGTFVDDFYSNFSQGTFYNITGNYSADSLTIEGMPAPKPVQGHFDISEISSQERCIFSFQPNETFSNDTWIELPNPNTNHATDITWYIGTSAAVNFRRGLINFYLENFPKYSYIINANLTAFTDANGIDGNGIVCGHRVLTSWGESTVTWNNFGSGSGGVNGTDWEAQSFGCTKPTGAGVGAGKRVNWDLTTLTGWYINGSNGTHAVTNLGFIVIPDNEGADNTGTWMQSSNPTTTAQRPQLNISYYCAKSSAHFDSRVFDAGNIKSWSSISWENASSYGGIYLQVKSCAQADCSDGSWSSSLYDKTGSSFSINNNQYFQYRAYFTTDNISRTPTLEWVNISYLNPTITDSSGNYNVSATSPSLTGIYEVIVNLTYSGVDFRNNASLAVVEYNAPYYSYNRTNFTSIKVSEKGQFNITWTDNVALDTIIFSVKNDSSSAWNNITTFRTSGTNIDLAFNLTMSSTSSEIFQWKFYANDSSGNWNESSVYSITISDTSSTWSNNGTNFSLIKVNEKGMFNITVNDADGLNSAIFSLKNSSAANWYNYSALRISGTSYELRYNLTISSNATQVLSWMYYFNDSAGAMYNSSVFDIIIDDTYATWQNNGTNATAYHLNDNVMFNITVNDADGLDRCIFSLKNSSALDWYNYSALDISGASYELRYNITISSITGQTLSWRYYCNDSMTMYNSTLNELIISNAAPVFTQLINDYSVLHNNSLSIKVNATDTEQSLSFWVNDSILTMTNETSTITNNWIGAQNGTYNIMVTAGDGLENSTDNFILTITENPPQFTQSINDYSYAHNSSINITVNATDSESDSITFKINDTRLTMENSTGKITGTIREMNATINILISLDDNYYNNTDSFTLTITNNAPTIASASISPLSPASADDLICNNGSISDAESDPLYYYYEWYNQSLLAANINGENNQVLGAGNTTINEQWYCKIIVGDGTDNTTKQSQTVSIETSFVSPETNNTNATTSITNIISDSTNPTNNNSWINFTAQFDDKNTNELHTLFVCKTDSATSLGCASTFCSSSLNMTGSLISCRYNISAESGQNNYYAFILDNSSLLSESLSGTFEVNLPPGKPNLLNPINDNYLSTDYANLSFSAADSDSDSITYHVLYSNGTEIAASLTPYNFTGLADSTYYWMVMAEDSHNYNSSSNSSIYNFTIDTTLPGINFTSSTEGNNTYFNRNYIFVNITAEEINFANITFNLWNKSGIVNTTIINSSLRNVNWTNLASDAEYLYNATAEDKAKNRNTTEIREINLDSISPVINLISPANLTSLSDPTPTIFFNITDNLANLLNYTMHINGSGADGRNQVDNGSYSNITLSLLARLETYIVTMNAVDEAGNVKNSSTYITLAPPVVYLNYPEVNSYLDFISINFTFNATDIGEITELNCSLYLENIFNQSNTTTPINTMAQFIVGLTEKNNYRWNISCFNLNGAEGQDSRLFSIDVTSPIASLNNPLDNSYSSMPVFGGTCIDTNPNNAYLYTNQTTWNNNATVVYTNNTAFNFSSLNFADGNYLWNIKCDDDSGNSNYSSSNYTLYIDSTYPSISLTNQTNNTAITAGTRIYITATDLSLTNVWYSNNSGENNYSLTVYDILTDNYIEQKFDFYVWANDSAGNINKTKFTFTVDNTDPIIALNNPANDTYTSNRNVTLGGTCTESNPSKVTLYGNWSGWNGNETISYSSGISFNFTSFNLTDGNYIWNIYCNDTTGRSSFNSTNYTLIIDTIIPGINFTESTEINNTYFARDYIYINTTIDEVNFANITFNLWNTTDIVNSTVYTSLTTSANFTDINEGQYWYNVTVVDKAGNSNTTEIRKITLDNTFPVITWSIPNNENGSVFNATFSQNITFADTNLNIFNCTIYSDSSLTVPLWSIEKSLGANTTFTKNDSVDISGLSDGIYYERCSVSDKE